MLLAFFSWWYGRGWRQVAKSFGPRIEGVLIGFSVRQLIRTLFAPWRRIITYPGASLADKFHAWGDNVVSRAVGFVVRLFVLLAAFVSVLAVACLTAIEIIIWPMLPLAIPGFIIAGLLV